MVIILPAVIVLQADVAIAFAGWTFLATDLASASAGPTLEWFHFGHVLMLALTAQTTNAIKVDRPVRTSRKRIDVLR